MPKWNAAVISCTAGDWGCLWRPGVVDSNAASCPSSVKSQSVSRDTVYHILSQWTRTVVIHFPFHLQVNLVDFSQKTTKKSCILSHLPPASFVCKHQRNTISSLDQNHLHILHWQLSQYFWEDVSFSWWKDIKYHLPPKPQRLNVIAQNGATQVHTSACKNCTVSLWSSFLPLSCLPSSNYACRAPSTAWPHVWLQVRCRYSTFHALTFMVSRLLTMLAKTVAFEFWAIHRVALLHLKNHRINATKRNPGLGSVANTHG